MKKLFSLLSVLLCVALLSTSAFAAIPSVKTSGEMSAYEVYQKYVKKSKAISSMELSTVQKISMVAGEQSVDLTKQTATIKMITKDNKLQMEMKMTDSATKETVYGYFKDNYLYEKVGNEKYKIKYNADDALAEAASVDTTLTKDDLKDATVEKVDDGIKITYKIKASDLDSSMTSIFEELDLPENIKMSFTSVTASLIIADDGTLKSMSNSYGINLKDGTDTIKLKATQKSTVKSVNSVTKINYPADLNTYKTIK